MGSTGHATIDALQLEAAAVAAAVAPRAAEVDALGTVDPEVHAALADSGLCGLLVPAGHGGRFDCVDPLAIAAVREVLMGTSSHLDSLFALQGIGSYAISIAGTEAQRNHWLPRVAAGEVLAALALTEPDAGSDLKGIATELHADGDGLRLRGDKAFISNGGAAGFYCVLARERDGFSMVLVPADRPGVEVVPSPEIAAPHVLGDAHFDDVQLTEADRIGRRGTGFDLVLATLSVFRVSVAGAAVGLGQAALDEALHHAATREQFGRPLARHGAVAAMLADSWAELEAARALTYRAGELARADAAANLAHSSMAKLVASETAGRIADRAVQIMGRFGLIRDAKVERLYRQARPMRIYEGASEVLRLGIARALVERAGDGPRA